MKIAIAAAVTLCVACADMAVAQVHPPQDRINTALARARQVGIPVSLLENKIAEGKAKGVSLERIAAAIERRESSLERASQVMKGQQGSGDAELAVAADALDSGVSDAVLKAVSESAPRDRRAVAIAALTQLVQLGHVPETALERVKQALKRGPEALINLPAEAGRGGRGSGPATVPDSAGGRGNAGGGGSPATGSPGGGPPSGNPQGGNPQGGGPPGGSPPGGSPPGGGPPGGGPAAGSPPSGGPPSGGSPGGGPPGGSPPGGGPPSGGSPGGGPPGGGPPGGGPPGGGPPAGVPAPGQPTQPTKPIPPDRPTDPGRGR
jgi:hypothetical protein